MASRKSGRGKVRVIGAKTMKRTVTAYWIEEPTPKMRAQVVFNISTIKCKMSNVIGRAYCRRILPERTRIAGAISPTMSISPPLPHRL